MKLLKGILVSLLVALTALAPGVSANATPASTTEGYIPMPDGVRLHYILYLPAGAGPFPTLFTYDQYAAGSPNTASTWTGSGYAVIGVNLRGSGCSTGINNWVDASIWGRDGYDVVEWIAQRSWSNGHVGMFGGSFPGLSQLAVAGFNPPHLDAIAPEQPTVDFYRDIAYPGGIYNIGWMSEYPAFIYNNQRPGYQDGIQSADAGCGAFTAQTQEGNLFLNAAINIPQHPYLDSYWASAPSAFVPRINIPVLGCQEWQDGAVGSRTSEIYLDGPLDPSKTWFVGTNGTHGNCNVLMDPMMPAFFDHFVKGSINGFETTPHITLGHELSGGEGLFGIGSVPAWTTRLASQANATQPFSLYFRSDGSMRSAAVDGAPQSYTYPLPSSSLGAEEFSGYENAPTWQGVDTPGGFLSYTTPALSKDLEFFGPASVNLYIATTATDSDLQVTLTEIRPDGMEQYIQRGWLRLSHRAEDSMQGYDPTRPNHIDTASSSQPMVPGEIALARVELMPFDHLFQKGSSIRLTIDAPTGTTFGDVFDFTKVPSQNTIFTSSKEPSSITLRQIVGASAGAALSTCNLVIDEPCRPNPFPAPGGSL